MRTVGRIIATMLFICLIVAYAEASTASQTEYAPPDGKGRVVVVVSGQTGPASYAYIAKDLAGQGYYAVLVDGNDFWKWSGKGETLLKDVITRAQQSPHALPGKVAVVGFSLGGASSLSYATRLPELVSAVVVYYPATYYIKDARDFVSKIKVPTLMFAAVRDTYKNCCVIETARKLADAAKASEGKVALEVVEYPYAGHGFSIKSVSAWRADDAADAFRRTLDHLRKYPGS
ncbi:MAG: dienelactone hydrolase family protein [Syntrophorhabdales bacterium]|jgi:dienelactone hydrolase